MYDPIHINQRSFLAGILADRFADIQNQDVFIASEGMQKQTFRNLLRMYYNHFYDELYDEIRQLIRENAHRISTSKSQDSDDYQVNK